MRVQPVAHVHLDAERLPAGDQAAPDHQRGLDHAERRRSPRRTIQSLSRVVRLDRLVDHAAGHPDERDLRGLRAARRGRSRRRARACTASGSRAGGRTYGDTEPARSPFESSRRPSPSLRAVRANERQRPVEPRAVRRDVQPAADAGRVRERDDGRAVALERLADAVGEAAQPEEAPDREAADGDDQLGPEQAQLPLEPERAELLLARRRGAVARAGRRPARVAARDRGAVEGRVERRPRRARASGGASGRRGRATVGARRPRRSPAPGRRCTRAGRRAPRAPGATRAGSRPRRTRGRRGCRAGAR